MMIRAMQGHSLPQVKPTRVYTPLTHGDLETIGVFVHGTDLKAFWNIMRQGQKPGGGAKGLAKGASRKINMLSAGGVNEGTGTRLGIREKSVVHIHYPALRCTELFMGVSVAGAYCTTQEIAWQIASYALIGRLLSRLSYLWHENFITLAPHCHPNFPEGGAVLDRTGYESDEGSEAGDVFVRAMPPRKGKGKGYKGAMGASEGRGSQDPLAAASWSWADDTTTFDDEGSVVYCP
jgi:hypothetical protein